MLVTRLGLISGEARNDIGVAVQSPKLFVAAGNVAEEHINVAEPHNNDQNT